MTHLGLEFNSNIEYESNKLEDGKLYNELLYVGSRLERLPQAKQAKQLVPAKCLLVKRSLIL